MSELILRPATPADISALARLGHDSFVAKFGALYRPEDLAVFLAQTYAEEFIAAEMGNPDRLYQLAEQDGALLAYCKLGLTCSWPKVARGSHVIELKQLYAAPGATGMGIGTKLMDWALAEARARGADEIQLSVFSGNLDGHRFYARHGFAKVGDTTFRVGEQLDAEFLYARMV